MKLISNRSGITLLETIIVLIIGGLVISGIWGAYSQISLNNKIQRTQNAISKTTANVRDFMVHRTQFPVQFSVMLHDQGLMPSELTFDNISGSTATYTSPLSQRFYVIPVTSGAVAQRAFYMHIGIRSGSLECKRLIPALIGTNRLITEQGIVGYSFGSIRRGQPFNDPPPLAAPTPNEILTNCAAGTTFIGLHYSARP